MVMGSQINPEMLREVIEGAIVAVVEIDSPSTLWGTSSSAPVASGSVNHDASEVGEDIDMDSDQQNGQTAPSTEDLVVRTPENLPYLFSGSGSCTPLDPKSSNCLGLAIVRSVNTGSHRLELSTPIPSSTLSNTIEQGRSIVLVRGQLDNPNWAISEEYHSARAAERRYQQSISRSKKNGGSVGGADDQAKQKQTLSLLRERIRRASNVPWMTVVEDNSRHQREAAARREKSLWKLRKKAYPASESETEW
jgi:polynucleotide 5'-hydroxyl-kinase GRC3/NOL9